MAKIARRRRLTEQPNERQKYSIDATRQFSSANRPWLPFLLKIFTATALTLGIVLCLHPTGVTRATKELRHFADMAPDNFQHFQAKAEEHFYRIASGINDACHQISSYTHEIY